MKHYPSICSNVTYDADVYAFDKLDGSNIRAEWSAKRAAFYKFGSRNRLIDGTEPILGRSLNLIKVKYERQLNDVFKDRRYESVICFFEFFGPNSFAGLHSASDTQDVVLFDIAPYKKGILPPEAFIAHTEGLDTPRMLHHGCMTIEIEHAIRSGNLPGMSREGVVCKTGNRMFKLKTSAWLKHLRDRCGDDEALFQKLA